MNRCFVSLISLCMLVLATASSAESFSAADVYRESAPAVVLIFGFNSKGDGSAGTGSIISEQGLILTNNHVIYDAKARTHYPKLTVYFKPAQITGNTKSDLKNGAKARVVARDEALDLALLKVEGIPQSARVISFGDSEATEIGSPVAAIGHPGGGGLWTLTTGTISSTRNDGKRQIFQTDTAINPGNSGGPLLDGSARLIGLNTYVKRVNAKGMPLEGLNYSLRSSLARRWLHGLGVQVTTASAPAARAATGAQSEPTRTPSRPPVDKAARSYETRSGEMAFGVPNIQFDLESTLGEVVSRAKKNARDAFDELDGMGSMDGDFDEADF
ncbi:MAG: trypsin-like peptidase domain-containing protein [Deltaproteobacteria bacterium]|nr:trypsin-like peptidase domain-containing protein [Deltaproteobacteria bacterium]